MHLWDQCLDPEYDRASLRKRKCYVGMDHSTTRDLSAIVAVFPDADGFTVLPPFFIPADNLREREISPRVPCALWVREGYLDATPGNVIDYDYIRKALHEWDEEFDIQEIEYDRYNATDIVTRLSNQDGFKVEEKNQGIRAMNSCS